MTRHRSLISLALLAVLVGGSGCTEPTSAAPPPSDVSPMPREPSVVSQVAARAQPSSVKVLTAGGNGSGVNHTTDGLIITNEHVVRGNTDALVAFADRRRARATDPITDIALLPASRHGLPAATFQSRLPVIGELAVVIGSPLGFENSVTAGVVSGLHRAIPAATALDVADQLRRTGRAQHAHYWVPAMSSPPSTPKPSGHRKTCWPPSGNAIQAPP